MNFLQTMVCHYLKIQSQDILKIERFQLGFLNDNYLIELVNHQKYVARITKPNPLINHAFEYQIMQSINQTNDIIYYDLQTGNYLRKYYDDVIHGNAKNCYSFLNLIIQKIKKLHNYPIPQQIQKKYNYEMYIDLNQTNNNLYFQTYKTILNQIKNNDCHKIVISHNDLNPTNILGYHQEIHFIDFEFSCLNYDYFDYGYFLKEIFIKEENLKELVKQNKWDYELMLSFIFITCYISYCWTLQMPHSKEINIYKQNIEQRLKYYFHLLKQTNKTN